MSNGQNDIEKMTQKSQEAMQAVAKLAEDRHHSAVETEHLIYEVLRQDDGIVPRVIAALEKRPTRPRELPDGTITTERGRFE